MTTLKTFVTELEAQNVNNLDFLIIHQSDLSTQEIEQSTGGIHCGKNLPDHSRSKIQEQCVASFLIFKTFDLYSLSSIATTKEQTPRL